MVVGTKNFTNVVEHFTYSPFAEDSRPHAKVTADGFTSEAGRLYLS